MYNDNEEPFEMTNEDRVADRVDRADTLAKEGPCGLAPPPAAPADYASDIPVDLARAAHRGTSFDPERRGEQERDGYAATLATDYENLSRHADTDEKRAALAAEFARYREGFRQRTIAHLQAKSRCLSTMIAGPSNFPVRRAEKANAAEHNRLTELLDYRKRALDAIAKVLRPELRPIMSGDADAAERLKAEIETAERTQAIMKAVNAAIRRCAKDGLDAQIAECIEAGLTGAQAREILQSTREVVAVHFEGRRAFADRSGFASSSLTNNNANIARMKKRLAVIERNKSRPTVAAEGASGTRFEDCPAENRVRIYFPDKPEAAVRQGLKAHGFRWAPTLGCWQAYRSTQSLAHAREVAGLGEPGATPPAEAPPPAGDWLPASGARVLRRELPSHRGTVVRSHPEGIGCDTCIGKRAHAVVRWDDGPDEFDEAPEDLAPEGIA